MLDVDGTFVSGFFFLVTSECQLLLMTALDFVVGEAAPQQELDRVLEGNFLVLSADASVGLLFPLVLEELAESAQGLEVEWLHDVCSLEVFVRALDVLEDDVDLVGSIQRMWLDH